MNFILTKLRLFLHASIVFLFLLTQSFGDIYHLKVPSLALSDSNKVIVATPTYFEILRETEYPFIIMLHGWSGDETQWENDANLQEICDTHDILLVLPDGGYDGWWVDTEVQPGRDYSTHIRQELKIWLIDHFNASQRPTQHGILGLSMGGYGSMLQALKHPDEYAAASSLSGVMDIPRHKHKWRLEGALGKFTVGAETWSSNNPIGLLNEHGSKGSPPLQLICGKDDFAFPENVDMAAKLKRLGYSVDFRKETGPHSHTFWKTHVETAVAFVVSHFKKR